MNSTWKNSIYQETVLMIICHVFLRIIALLKHAPWNTGSALGMNTACAHVDYSRDYPNRERPGVKTRRSGLHQCSVLGKIDHRKFCSL